MASVLQNGVWSCGFDFLPTGSIASGGVWDIGASCTVGSAYARFGIGQGCEFSAGTSIARSLGENIPTLIGGFGFYSVSLPSGLNGICTLYDTTAGAAQVTLGYNSQGEVGFYTVQNSGFGEPNALLGTASAANVIIPNNYYFIEFFATIGSAGSLIIRVNGVQVYSYTGNTEFSGNSWVNRFYIGSSGFSSITQYFDDVYLLDTTGQAPLNTFLGPGRAQTSGPSGESATVGLNVWAATNPTGTDYGNCANIPANSAQYNSSATVGQRMSLSFPALTGYVQCLFMNTWISAEEDAAGTRGITPIYRSNGVDQNGTAINLSASYAYYNQTSTIDPNTAEPWADGTITAAQNCEIGLIVSS